MGGVYGRAGGSLGQGGFASAAVARIGRRGETATARVLDELAATTGIVVLHDLSVPGYEIANIDHLVVTGRRVVVVDSKAWRPDFYWSVRGRIYRGRERFRAAEKRSVPAQIGNLSRYLGGRAKVHPRGVQVVWPSNSSRPMRLWAARFPGARAVAGPRFERAPRHVLPALRAADDSVVGALLPLVRM